MELVNCIYCLTCYSWIKTDKINDEIKLILSWPA